MKVVRGLKPQTETQYVWDDCCNQVHGDFVWFSGYHFRKNHKSKAPGTCYCKYCGQLWQEEKYLDAAGDSDWRWVRLPVKVRPKAGGLTTLAPAVPW